MSPTPVTSLGKDRVEKTKGSVDMSERTIQELEKLIADYGEDYHQGFFKKILDELKGELHA
jgi:predicted translin family RNA/ssDNA-binding protein